MTPSGREWPRPNSPLSSDPATLKVDFAAVAAADEQYSRAAADELRAFQSGADPELAEALEGAPSFDEYLQAMREARRLEPVARARAHELAGASSKRARPTYRPGAWVVEERVEEGASPEAIPQRGGGGDGRAAPPTPGTTAAAAQREARRRRVVEFALTPKAVKAHLDSHVVSQEEATKALAVAVCDHYNFVRGSLAAAAAAAAEGADAPTPPHHLKPNVLLLGPSGVGKTHLMRALSELLGVPFVKADATKFSATGYVGADVDELVRSLLPAAEGDELLAECGIVYVDEVDKLADGRRRGLMGGAGGGVNTREVQLSLLKLMEDAEVPLLTNSGAQRPQRPAWTPPSTPTPPAALRTRHVLFIFSGAFTELEATLRQAPDAAAADATAAADAAAAQARGDGASARELLKRIADGNKAAADGGAAADGDGDGGAAADVLQNATTSDYINYGLEAEFVGRIPVRVACRHLGTDDLRKVLTEVKGSVAEQLSRNFEGYGINLELSECALQEVAARAVAQRTGARGLLTVLEEALRDFKYELPSTSVKRLVVTAETIRDPCAALEEILREDAQKAAEEVARERYE